MIGVIDRSLFEVFLDGGARSATQSFFPMEPLTEMTLRTANILDDMVISVAVYALESGWADQENDEGTVVGNVTRSRGSGSGSGYGDRRHRSYKAHFTA
jgi:beta-fructofuranosidase